MSDEALPCLARSLSKTFRLRHVSAQGAGASGASTTALSSSRGMCADKPGEAGLDMHDVGLDQRE